MSEELTNELLDGMSIEDVAHLLRSIVDDPEAVDVFETEGVTYEVVAKMRAVKEDGSTMDVAGPVQLIFTSSSYRALFVMSGAIREVEHQIDGAQVMDMAARINAIVATSGSSGWTKPKGE
jgi:hypothetical protein